MTVPRRSRTYLTLYFNLERTEDLDLLTLLYALPVTRRGPAVKSLLRADLAAYLHAHHPDRPPLDRQAVHDLVATRARARRRRRRGQPAEDGGRGAPSCAPVPHHEVGPPGIPGQGLDELTGNADQAPSGNAEVRLDRLLRSFLR
jgi:hypothetical protein